MIRAEGVGMLTYTYLAALRLAVAPGRFGLTLRHGQAALVPRFACPWHPTRVALT